MGPYPVELNKMEDGPFITAVFPVRPGLCGRVRFSVLEWTSAKLDLVAYHYARLLPQLAAAAEEF